MSKERLVTKPCPCPYCGKVLDRATKVNEEGPNITKPGDYSICLGCHNVLKFDRHLMLRKLTPKEDIDLRLGDQWDEIQDIIAQMRRFKRTQG